MPSINSLLTMAAAAGSASAAFQGFNYGATFTDGSVKGQSDFENEFKTAAGLEGTDGGFTSARLYTMIQGGTPNQPISAIPAAIKTKTSMLFGLWASGDGFANEIAALKNTADQYCDQLDGLVAGISVGSEDLYRISPTGLKNNENPGTNPDVLVDYIKQTRDAIKGTCLESVPVGHVDTWTAYANSSNNAVIEACDWLGMDAYPYFEDTKNNPISEGAQLFKDAWNEVKAVANGKEIWVTETGWPVSGKTVGKAVPNLKNARTYYEEVACPMFGDINVWWYTLQDSAPQTPNPSFGVIGSELTEKPLYDLSCSSESKKGTLVSRSDDKSGNVEHYFVSPSFAVNEKNVTVPVVPVASGTSTTLVAATPSSSSGAGAGSATTPVPGSGAEHLNSMGAAAVAVILAAALL
ncbi:glycoside hydrolase superfamily [Fusarium flagelliforme]|uniref:Probable glucan endo-1,3-beta-glucosidase eglC n=1 Tax=Fusarium flagelliforme TaxID=2675880 RepID=A0A395MR48_9HYPO|nr:glycoside hydrolase superfamily [Fusarium flagelliforme]KAH7189287.1 glycoside hydrolase superfamily [Fusarium flagelliforme]RFN49599.1 murein transglycosylase [Fusarium flagelliforme]